MENPGQTGFQYTVATIALTAFSYVSKGLSFVLLKLPSVNAETIKEIQPYVSFASSIGAIVTTVFAIRYYIIASRKKKEENEVKYYTRKRKF